MKRLGSRQFAAILGLLLPAALAGGQAESVSEGPHVVWQPDGAGVEALWVRDGVVERRSLPANETIVLQAPFLGPDGLPIDLQPPVAEPATYEHVGRILAVGDSHGEYEVLVDLLQSQGAIDDALHWSFGEGHLVIVGDVFDRGDKVTETLWLIHRLEGEAKAAGGRVHFVLGNHEIMPLQDDLRYVNAQYRETVCPALEMTYPELYGPRTLLGRWLRTKNVVVRLNDIVFVHGGLSPTLVDRGWDLAFLNRRIRAHIDTSREAIKADDDLSLLFRSEGPLWYRGYIIDWSHYERTTPEATRRVLDFYGGDHVVVGHTGATKVHSIFGGMVINVHVKMRPGEPAEALLWENGVFHRVNAAGLREPLDLNNETWFEAE